MLLSNLESVPGHRISQQLDVVYGSTVRSKQVGRDFLAGLKNIVGGELTAYTGTAVRVTPLDNHLPDPFPTQA